MSKHGNFFCGSGHGPESSSQISVNYKFFSGKALSPPRISQIFQSAEIPKRKISEILKEFLGGASILHQNIPTEISIIFASKFLQSGRCKKFSVEHTLWQNVVIHSQGQTKTSFLNKSFKNNCRKADCKTSKIKAIV